MSKKMGRPTTNPKNEIIKIRATKDDREKLLFCCEKTKKTQYDVVMEGIDKVYSELKKREESQPPSTSFSSTPNRGT